MGKYIKLFENHSGYEDYAFGDGYKFPNVSYCEDNLDVHYNIPFSDKLICIYDVDDVTNPTALVNAMGNVDGSEIWCEFLVDDFTLNSENEKISELISSRFDINMGE